MTIPLQILKNSEFSKIIHLISFLAKKVEKISTYKFFAKLFKIKSVTSVLAILKPSRTLSKSGVSFGLMISTFRSFKYLRRGSKIKGHSHPELGRFRR
mgnify:CR=1 FL=1